MDKEIKIEKKGNEIPVEDLRELFGVINQQVPDLIKNLFASIYNAETAEQYAKGIATIYRTLTEQGLPEEMVEKLTMKYANSMDILGKALENIDYKDRKGEED
ncbi:MAG: hypothetical protein KGD59_01190 [Candidatus Heimdallarchaeota archaeon]|nr:hypothetical protein [Candidatus Heimdallarchaeota archaeon]MBY8993134.1 hypothetical protein [Candidatus Heimdallarchaeota archaeon]